MFQNADESNLKAVLMAVSGGEKNIDNQTTQRRYESWLPSGTKKRESKSSTLISGHEQVSFWEALFRVKVIL